MGMTMTEKILARASGAASVRPGQLAVVNVETTVTMDSTFQPERLAEERWRDVQSVHNPDKIAVILDHLAPAPDVRTATAHKIAREFAEKFGIKRFHDVGPDLGICHSVVAEKGLALPGTVLVNSDSHTCAGGAFNCAARGIGRPDLVYTVVTGQTWFYVGETVRYDLQGSLRPGATAKDVFLYLAGAYGSHNSQNIEYGGPGLASLSMNARQTLATMGTELSADFSIFEPDERLTAHMQERNPDATYYPTMPDEDAVYKERRSIDLASMEPLVALPDAMLNQTVPIGEVAGQRIDQAFIGSCANGTLEDIAAAARIVKGRKVARGTRLIVTPGTQSIYLQALRAGYIEALIEAGAVVTNATCGACMGGHLGILAPDETCITSSTRNFKGRMGAASAKIYMASSETVAASAIAGTIASADEFFTGELS